MLQAKFYHWSKLLVATSIAIFALSACGGTKLQQIQATPAATAESKLEHPSHDVLPPKITKWTKNPTVLVFSKTSAWRHHEGIAAADLHFVRLARKFGFGIYTTENGAIFNDKDLKTFNVIVFNSATGDMLSTEQEQAFERWLKAGGGWLGLHGSGDASQQKWQWYQQHLIGPKFIGHPNKPHLQHAKITNLAQQHPVMSGIPNEWMAFDEWYSFDGVPQSYGLTPLAGLNESSYSPMFNIDKAPEGSLAMGERPEQHPIIWSTCVEQGRAVYSALGHHDKVYDDVIYQQLLNNAMSWVAKKTDPKSQGC